MKNIALIVFCLITMLSCKKLDTKIDAMLTDENLNTNYQNLFKLGYAAYTYVDNGFYSIDNNLFAAVSDEAEQTLPNSQTELFNSGAWNAFNNPNDVYEYFYNGIRATNYFLENSVNYKYQLQLNRDTISDGGFRYKLDVEDMQQLRAENRVLRAYFYYELLKRYGGVPLINKVLESSDNSNVARSSYQEVVEYIVSEIDAVKDSLNRNWVSHGVSKTGRIDLGASLALKSRVLLYAASPLNNPTNDIAKWEAAASAAYEVINLKQYGFAGAYGNVFIREYTAQTNEVIWAIRMGQTNELEKKNYPIGTPGGNTGITPSQNLVKSYEYTSKPAPDNPYANRDPRLAATVAFNNSDWTGRKLQIWSGGIDDPNKANTSKTGYYLRKFLNNGLNLTQNASLQRSWVVFRYPEIYLNFAEAMNEAYGPDDNHGYSISARQAINLIRQRSALKLPAIIAKDKNELKDKIKHERRVELAFENHRYWDLLRWKDAEIVLNQPLLGVKVTNIGNNKFAYEEFEVEKRVFESPKMYRYPIPYTEIQKSKNVLKQNEGW